MLSPLFSVAQETSIDEKKFVVIGGIEQWITIKGTDMADPVILFIHGGPGSPSSPYSEAIFGDWENDFILANWDQRGTARTFGRNAPQEPDEDYWIENPLTLEQMTTDGVEVSEYLKGYLGKEKIILLGSSWGSVLATKMALLRPEIFYAYIGHSQVVNPAKDIVHIYHKMIELARQKEDSETLEVLKYHGVPPYQNAKHTGQLMRIIKKYEHENSVPSPEFWWKIPSEYDNEKDEQHRYNGDDYSFIHYAGHNPLGIIGMNASVNFMKETTNFQIPVYLIQGEKDILTPLDITEKYYEKITAPEKELFVVPGAAHGFNQAIIEEHQKVLLERILPGIKKKQLVNVVNPICRDR